MNPTKNLIEPKLYMNPTRNLMKPQLYMNFTKNLIEPKPYMNPTKNLMYDIGFVYRRTDGRTDGHDETSIPPTTSLQGVT